MIVVVAQIHEEGQADLFEVVQADGLLAFLFGPAQCRQQECGEDGNDGDDHQQFNQREGAPEFIPIARRDCQQALKGHFNKQL